MYSLKKVKPLYRPGLKSGPLDLELSTLTMRPPCLHQCSTLNVENYVLVIHISEVGRSEIWYLIGTQKLPSVPRLGHQYLKMQGDTSVFKNAGRFH